MLIVPTGWKLVPIEPTEPMMDAGLYQASHDAQWADVFSSWKDMLAAAPELPESAQMTEQEIRDDERRRIAAMFLRTKTVSRTVGAMSQFPTEYMEDVPCWPNGDAIAQEIQSSHAR